MCTITLLSSFHIIQGKCNPEELHKIIEEIKPDVIFEELSQNGFEIVYSTNYEPKTVEAITIKRYLQKHAIRHFPVDTVPTKEEDLLSDAQVIWNHSIEYRELFNQHLMKVQQQGFAFLNSTDCMEMLSKMAIIEEFVLTEIGNPKLLNELRKEKILHDKREKEMLKNILKYSLQYPYHKALFICGAEHRLGFMEKIKTLDVNNRLNLNWIFFEKAIS